MLDQDHIGDMELIKKLIKKEQYGRGLKNENLVRELQCTKAFSKAC